MSGEDPSGILVYPKVERGRDPRKSDSTPPPNVKGFPRGKKGGGMKKRAPLFAGIAGAAVLGAGIGYVAKPSHADEIAAERTAAKKAEDDAKQQVDAAKKQLDQVTQDKAKVDQQLADLSSKAG